MCGKVVCKIFYLIKINRVLLLLGMGGIFLLKRGAAHQHVMRDFSQTPINSEEEVNNWLKFYEMPAQLNAVGTLITHENVSVALFLSGF